MIGKGQLEDDCEGVRGEAGDEEQPAGGELQREPGAVEEGPEEEMI